MQQLDNLGSPDNGVPAGQLAGITWRKSRFSNPEGECVELAGLPGGAVAVRNSRDPEGPALVYTHAEITAFLLGAKDGHFDDLIDNSPAVQQV